MHLVESNLYTVSEIESVTSNTSVIQVRGQQFGKLLENDTDAINSVLRFLLNIETLTLSTANASEHVILIAKILSADGIVTGTATAPNFIFNVSQNQINASAYLIEAIQTRTDDMFDGMYENNDITLIRLIGIWDSILNCPEIDPNDLPNVASLTCIVDKTRFVSPATESSLLEIDDALKKRIIKAVQAILPSYNPLDSDIEAYIASKTAYELFDLILFKYNRTGAASYAINTSRANFEGNDFVTGNNDITGQSPRGVGSSMTYSNLSHTTVNNVQQTGSAYFISEAMLLGGKIPMSAKIQTDCNNLQVTDSRYAICCAGTNLEATEAFRQHSGIMSFFEEEFQGQEVGQVRFGDDNTDTNGLLYYMFFDESQTVGGGTWRVGQETTGPQFLYSAFATGDLALLETGDYMYVNLGNNGLHGFLIVGWGDAKNCSESLNAVKNIDFTVTRTRDENDNPTSQIPYIADFPYGYNATLAKTGWLQDPRPRPFYASQATLSAQQITDNLSRLDISNSQDYENKVRGQYRRFEFIDVQAGISGHPSSWTFFHFSDTLDFSFSQLVPLIFPCPT